MSKFNTETRVEPKQTAAGIGEEQDSSSNVTWRKQDTDDTTETRTQTR